jgi:hypothetical protein
MLYNSSSSRSESNLPLLAQQPESVSVPEPTFGPGDLRYNRRSRKINPGFEVLPAWTFGAPQQLPTPDDSAAGSSRGPSSRLHKKAYGQQ